jgi:kumamolisin
VAGLNTHAVLRSLARTDPSVTGGTPTRTGTPAGCSGAIASGGFTPNQTMHAYGVDPLHKLGLAGQGMTMAILTFADDYVLSDVNKFRSCFSVTGTEPTRVVLPGSPAPFPAVEPDLDVETVLPIASKLADLYVIEDPGVLGTNSGATLPIGLSGAVNPANTGGKAPNVVSISYGGYEKFFSRSAILASERVLKSAAAAGVTVVAASGDTGSNAGYYQGQQSLSVAYPSSSAWVTAVGGTNLTLGLHNAIQGQAVWNDSYPNFPHDTGAGGGGASVLFGLPLWQNGPGVTGTRRVVPDVSFFADYSPGYANYCSMSSCSGGQGPGWGAFGGTSLSAPFFGASVVLLDHYLVSTGRPVLGAVNALLYLEASGSGQPQLFDDVVLGNNDLFGLGCCTAGPGYDAASGLGSLRLGAWPGALSSLR